MRPSRRSLAGLLLLLVVVSAVSAWWSNRHAGALGSQVASLARPGDIRMLASETCGVCVTARLWMTQHQVPFGECMIERDAACRAEFEAMRAPGTPVMVVRGVPQLGFSPERLREALKRPG